MTELDANTFFDEGVDVYLGFGKSLTLYPLTWGAQRRLNTEWKMIFGGGAQPGSTDWIEASLKVLHASASRGNASITEDDLAEMIDWRNGTACFKALAAATGMKPRETKEGDLRPTLAPNGADSTTPSSLQQDGPLPNVTN